MTTKSVGLVPVPVGPVTAILPVVAPVGTVAVIWVAESTTKLAGTPLKVTAVAPVKLVPVITTLEPGSPLAGENAVTPGAVVKSIALVAVPAELDTVIRPVVAPEGTVAVIRVEELTVNWADTPLNVTEVMAVKFVPLIVTEVPGAPEVGVKDVMVGVRVTMKSLALVPVPLPVVTVILPVSAPVGTVVVIWVFELTVNDALTPPKRTVIVPVKPEPVSTTVVPIGPLVGVNEEITGAPWVTVKFVAEVPVPFGVVTVMRPVVAPAGTVAVIRVEELTVKFALTPLNRTAVAPVKFVPVMVTVVPGAPLVGVKLVTVGPAGVTTKLELLVAVPCGVTTWIAPVPAVAGTTAVI